MSRTSLFGALCGDAFLVNFARVVFAPLLSVFMVTFGVGPATAGLVVTAAWLGSAVPRVPTGYLLTRVSRFGVVVAAGGLLALGAAVAALSTGVWSLAAGAAVMGAASGVYFVAGNPFVSELFPERVGRMLGIHGTANQVAAVLAAPAVTVVLLVAPPDLAGWRLLFGGVAVGAVAVTALVVLTGRRAALPDAGGADRHFLRSARAEWRIVAVGVLVLGVTGFVWQGVFNFYELYMETRGLSPALARNSLTLVFGAGVPAFAVSGRLADRLPHVPYMLALVGAFVAEVLALTVVSGVVALLALSVLVGFTIHSLFPALDTYLLDTLPDRNRASAYAVYSGVMMLVQAPGSWAVGALVEAGYAYATVFGTLVLGVAAVAVGLAALEWRGALP